MVSLLVDKELRELLVGVERVNDRLISIKIVVGGLTLKIVSAYTPQASLDEEVKMCFWEDFDELMRGIPQT